MAVRGEHRRWGGGRCCGGVVQAEIGPGGKAGLRGEQTGRWQRGEGRPLGEAGQMKRLRNRRGDS